MSTHTIEFSVQATVKQEIKIINNKYQIQDIISGLQNRALCTTLWYGKNVKHYITDSDPDNYIAEILNQEIEGDYFDFEEN